MADRSRSAMALVTLALKCGLWAACGGAAPDPLRGRGRAPAARRGRAPLFGGRLRRGVTRRWSIMARFRERRLGSVEIPAPLGNCPRHALCRPLCFIVVSLSVAEFLRAFRAEVLGEKRRAHCWRAACRRCAARSETSVLGRLTVSARGNAFSASHRSASRCSSSLGARATARATVWLRSDAGNSQACAAVMPLIVPAPAPARRRSLTLRFSC